MSDRQRPSDLGAEDAREICARLARELRGARQALGISQRVAARRAGMSSSQLGRIERAELTEASIDQLWCAGRAIGLKGVFGLYPAELRMLDDGQLAVLGRFEHLLAEPLHLRREVTLPIAGDQRAWDGRIVGKDGTASIECEAKLRDLQALARRIALKQRDDPRAGVVILVVNRTAHNRQVLAGHREALRAQFPLDGAAIARALRSGRVPSASGIILV